MKKDIAVKPFNAELSTRRNKLKVNNYSFHYNRKYSFPPYCKIIKYSL